MPKRFDNSRVLVLSDTHAPYHHKGTLDFLSSVNAEFKPDRVVHAGDLADIYSISEYPKDLSHKDTWGDEIKGLRKFTKELGTLFPRVDLLESNHDSRPYRKSVVAGVPREFLVKYLDVIGAPPDWRLHSHLNITVDADRSNWTMVHSFGGSNALNVAKHKATNIVMGHHHSRSGIASFNNGKRVVHGCDTGCLISDQGSPYRYNKLDIGRPIRSVLMIIEGSPQLIRM